MFKTIKKILDRSLEILVMVFMATLVFDVCWQVFIRLAPKNLITWMEGLAVFLSLLSPTLAKIMLALLIGTGTEELATFLLIWVVLLGAAVALNRGAHLGIDYFVGKLPIRTRIYTEVFVFICIALFSLCVMVIGGISIVARTLELGQISPAWGVKIGYVYLAIPISGCFLVFYSVIGLVERVVELLKRRYDLQQKLTSPDEQISAY